MSKLVDQFDHKIWAHSEILSEALEVLEYFGFFISMFWEVVADPEHFYGH